MLLDLKPDMYQVFLDSLFKKGLSKRTVEIINSTVYSAIEHALIQEKIKKLEKRNIDKYEEYTSRIFGSENQKTGGRLGGATSIEVQFPQNVPRLISSNPRSYKAFSISTT